MSKSDFVTLKRAVEELHGCEANYLTSEHVRESLGDTLVFDGGISVFGLTGHPAATMCYAWSAENTGTPNRTFYAVLRMAPVQSARDAVRVSLALRQRASAP
jgi:hypothetical protein